LLLPSYDDSLLTDHGSSSSSYVSLSHFHCDSR